MDNYIRMANCPEIQEQWAPRGEGKWRMGDRFTLGPSNNAAYGDIVIVCPHGVHPDRKPQPLKGAIWLPRQEDIQEMWRDKLPDFSDGIPDNWMTDFIYCFYRWAMASDFDKSLLFAPIVDLQLAFYMYEVHNKQWDNEKGWV